MKKATIHPLARAVNTPTECATDRQTVAPLLVGLLRALAHCPVEERCAIGRELEAYLPAPFDDFDEKLEILLNAAMEDRERVYSLWMFYLSIFCGEPVIETLWIGPDFLGGDDEECLRIMAKEISPHLLENLAAELTVLARWIFPDLGQEGAQTSLVTARTDTSRAKFSLRG